MAIARVRDIKTWRSNTVQGPNLSILIVLYIPDLSVISITKGGL